MTAQKGGFPMIRALGLTGLLVSFDDRLSEPANRAALAFRAAVESEAWPGVEETSTSLASVFLRFDPVSVAPADLRHRIAALLAARDWLAAPLPANRRRWHIPTVYGTELAPQLHEAAAAAGMSPDAAIAELSRTSVRVLTIGFAPGQPYLGELPPAWDIPRQVALTRRVPEGALVVAIRQFVLFSAATPTGWRHIGQTAFRAFRPESAEPFPLRPGDELIFPAIGREEYEALRAADTTGDGGAEREVIG
jgi:KipI family sensor histidine kinase inhibitor